MAIEKQMKKNWQKSNEIRLMRRNTAQKNEVFHEGFLQ